MDHWFSFSHNAEAQPSAARLGAIHSLDALLAESTQINRTV
jgi:hypothetical protein